MPRRLVREHLLTALLESPEEGILSVSLDGTIEIWSQKAERLYGCTAQEIMGPPLSRLVPLHEWPELKSIFSEAGGTPVDNGRESADHVELGQGIDFSKHSRWCIRGPQGHLAGNRALKRLAAVMNAHRRSNGLGRAIRRR